jgi:hypothetical protein
MKTKQNENDLIQQIGNYAISKAQKDSLNNGVPNVYSKNGSIYYQLVDGSITMKSPFDEKEFKDKFKILSMR